MDAYWNPYKPLYNGQGEEKRTEEKREKENKLKSKEKVNKRDKRKVKVMLSLCLIKHHVNKTCGGADI
jgi:hypothetical protein